MTAFEKVIKIGMIRIGISSVQDLADRSGICRATIYRRFQHPQGCAVYELAALSDVLGITIGELAETCRGKK